MFNENIIIPFLNAIKKHGDKNAFCIANKFYDYLEFSQHISKIRKALQLERIERKNIGLIANDDIETYASIFALWLEGFAYVPLHPQQPLERNIEIISQADIELVLNSANNNSFSGLKEIKTANLKFSEFILNPKITSDDDLAYILFTSGSTGKPKGVPIMRSNIGAFLKSFLEEEFDITHEDKCLQCFDLTFDVSIQAFLTPLVNGACAYTIPHDQIKYSYVYGLFDDHQLTFSVMAPSMLRYLRPYFDEINVDSMRYCILTAEASPVDLVEEWSKCVPKAKIYDFYGPTEATIYCTYYKFNNEANKHLNGMLSIGRAMKGLEAIIINEEKEILNLNQKGELCISGPQLTPGYWKNNDKTSESFFEIEFKGRTQRFYKTGDSCYFDDDGQIMYAGRLDYQVKIQGFRIELGEIEYHARQYLEGQNAIAITFENKTGNTEIALFIEGEFIDANILIEYLKSKMPYYMVPTKIISKNTLPLNSNGKIDRNSLKKAIVI